MAYHYRQRSREPPAVGQNVDVFTPLPSIHDQARQIQQTGIRPQFGINQRNPAPRQQHQAPARQRARSHVRDVDPVDLIARNLEAPVPKNSHKRSAPMTERILQDHRRRSRSREPHVRTRYEDDNVPEKRSRGRPARNQNEPPASSSAKDSRNSRSGVNPEYRIPMTRARSREPCAVPAVNPITRARSREPCAVPAVNPIRRSRSREPCAVPAVNPITRSRSREPCAVPAVNQNQPRYTADSRQRQSRKSRTPESVVQNPLRRSRRSIEPQNVNNPKGAAQPFQGQRSNRTNPQQAPLSDSNPPSQQPSSSSNTTNPQQASREVRRPVMANQNIMKEPCIGSMVVKLYDPNTPGNSNAIFAPNIFGNPAILENVNGGNAIGYLVDATRKYFEKRC